MVIDDELAHRFQRAREERHFWEEHFPDLVAQFPDQWVAVYQNEVIGRARHIWDLVEDLETRGVDPRESWITFLNATQRAISL